mmetsp:Transcript_21822/g.46701  ORF Transcript_21822/g.46701 Transcript_21822/m.46701 type:complete len:203 (+) Transcript_21822:167-775(+)
MSIYRNHRRALDSRTMRTLPTGKMGIRIICIGISHPHPRRTLRAPRPTPSWTRASAARPARSPAPSHRRIRSTVPPRRPCRGGASSPGRGSIPGRPGTPSARRKRACSRRSLSWRSFGPSTLASTVALRCSSRPDPAARRGPPTPTGSAPRTGTAPAAPRPPSRPWRSSPAGARTGPSTPATRPVSPASRRGSRSPSPTRRS